MFGFGSKDVSAWSMSESTVTKVPPLGEEEIPHETDVDARKFRTQDTNLGVTQALFDP